MSAFLHIFCIYVDICDADATVAPPELSFLKPLCVFIRSVLRNTAVTSDKNRMKGS